MASRCTLPIPAFALTLDPSGRRAHWLAQAERHGLDLQLERAVGPAELPANVLQQLEGLNNATLQKARKGLGIWASNRRFLAAVAARNATPALYIEDDAELKPGFCEHTAAALRALRARALPWDTLFVGHCAEANQVQKCSRIATSTKAPLWLSKGRAPMCTHAYIASPRGAARTHALLAGWPHDYAREILRTARPGWEKLGVSTRRRPTKRPVDQLHDVAVAKFISRGQLKAWVMWPQASLQPWMKHPENAVAFGTADLAVPPLCRWNSTVLGNQSVSTLARGELSARTIAACAGNRSRLPARDRHRCDAIVNQIVLDANRAAEYYTNCRARARDR